MRATAPRPSATSISATRNCAAGSRGLYARSSADRMRKNEVAQQQQQQRDLDREQAVPDVSEEQAAQQGHDRPTFPRGSKRGRRASRPAPPPYRRERPRRAPLATATRQPIRRGEHSSGMLSTMLPLGPSSCGPPLRDQSADCPTSPHRDRGSRREPKAPDELCPIIIVRSPGMAELHRRCEELDAERTIHRSVGC